MELLNKLFWIDKEYDTHGSSRIGMFDFAKGLAILGIVLTHTCNHYYNFSFYDGGNNPWIRILFSPLTILRYGAVPMMFMICGYGLRKQRIKKNIKQNLSMFILPYGFLSLAMLLIVLVKQMVNGGSFLRRFWKDVLPFLLGMHPGTPYLGDFMNQIGPSWFFFTYFFAAILLNIICQEKEQWIQIVMIAVGSIFAINMAGLILPFCFQQIIICCGFMYVGMCMKKGRFTQKVMPSYVYWLVYIACTFGSAIGGLAEIGNNIYFRGVQDLIFAYIAGVLLVYVCRHLDVCQGMICDGIRWIGRRMLWFNCFHTIAYLAIPWNKVAAMFGERRFLVCCMDFIFNLIYAVTACVILDKIVQYFYAKKSKGGRKR